MGSITGFGRSPGGRHGNPLQYACLGNPMDRGALWAAVAKSRTQQVTEQGSKEVYLESTLGFLK